ncbi:hypothetical protein MBLNU13_g07835t1 [Cladosporium sp. NU13]
MDPAASAVGIARSGTQICKELLTYLVMWKSFHGVYDSVADLNRLLHLLIESLRLRHDLEKTRCISTCLFNCGIRFLELAQILKDLREHVDTSKVLEGRRRVVKSNTMISWRTWRRKVAALEALVVKIREHLEPAEYAVKHGQAYANIATTSGVEKDQTTRHRPPAQQHRSHAPSPATGHAEEGELAEASRYCQLTKATRFFMPIPCGELRPQGRQGKRPPSRRRLRLPVTPRVLFHRATFNSLTTPPTYTTHSLATTTTTTATATTLLATYPSRWRERQPPALSRGLFITSSVYSKHRASRVPAPPPPAPAPQGEHIATERYSRTVLEDCAVTARAGIPPGIFTAE